MLPEILQTVLDYLYRHICTGDVASHTENAQGQTTQSIDTFSPDYRTLS